MHYLTVGKLIEELQKYKSSLMVVDTCHDNSSNLISASDIELVTVKWSNDYKSLIQANQNDPLEFIAIDIRY